MKTGTITITSTSQAVQNGLVNIPISFEVLAPAACLATYNEDGKVDAADYVVWRKNETANNPLPNDDGLATQDDRFNLWRDALRRDGNARRRLLAARCPSRRACCLCWSASVWRVWRAVH